MSADGSVPMRTISPVLYENAILIFTRPGTLKYRQLKENVNCCVELGCCFMEAKAEFKGHTMLDENSALRDVYSKKFSDAFTEGVELTAR
jgi:hypothetical protein